MQVWRVRLYDDKGFVSKTHFLNDKDTVIQSIKSTWPRDKQYVHIETIEDGLLIVTDKTRKLLLEAEQWDMSVIHNKPTALVGA